MLLAVDSSVTSTSISLVPDSTQELLALILLNASQLPIKLFEHKLSFLEAEIDALLFGFDLLGYLDETKLCPDTVKKVCHNSDLKV